MKYLLLALLLTGCATEEYSQYAKSSEASSVARSQALAKIAESTDPTAKVAAVMALAIGNGNNQIAPPPQNQVLQWLSIIVPSLTQAYGIRMNAITSIATSENATKAAIATNDAFVGIAGKIQAPVVNPPIIPPVVVPGAVTTTTTTLNGTGTLGGGSYATTDSHAVATSTIDNHAADNHTITPTPVVVTPVVPVVPVIVVPPVVAPAIVTPVTGGTVVGPN